MLAKLTYCSADDSPVTVDISPINVPVCIGGQEFRLKNSAGRLIPASTFCSILTSWGKWAIQNKCDNFTYRVDDHAERKKLLVNGTLEVMPGSTVDFSFTARGGSEHRFLFEAMVPKKPSDGEDGSAAAGSKRNGDSPTPKGGPSLDDKGKKRKVTMGGRKVHRYDSTSKIVRGDGGCPMDSDIEGEETDDDGTQEEGTQKGGRGGMEQETQRFERYESETQAFEDEDEGGSSPPVDEKLQRRRDLLAAAESAASDANKAHTAAEATHQRLVAKKVDIDAAAQVKIDAARQAIADAEREMKESDDAIAAAKLARDDTSKAMLAADEAVVDARLSVDNPKLGVVHIVRSNIPDDEDHTAKAGNKFPIREGMLFTIGRLRNARPQHTVLTPDNDKHSRTALEIKPENDKFTLESKGLNGFTTNGATYSTKNGHTTASVGFDEEVTVIAGNKHQDLCFTFVIKKVD